LGGSNARCFAHWHLGRDADNTCVVEPGFAQQLPADFGARAVRPGQQVGRSLRAVVEECGDAADGVLLVSSERFVEVEVLFQSGQQHLP
jgi:hypothetical protein